MGRATDGSILFVCLGNICRSPLAQGVFEHHAKKAGLDVLLDSAGTAGYHQGHSPDPRAIEVANEWGIDISEQRARRLVKDDFLRFEQIFVMDRSNLQAVESMAPIDGLSRIEMVLKLLGSGHSPITQDVPDPYYGHLDDFRSALALLDQAASAWVDHCLNFDGMR